MGLAVSQVRLLALTNRKADIELRMQIDTKRKMMLTRKSTELAQQYYSKLQNSNIQYATSAGYEDVNYHYLMGETDVSGQYNASFLQSLAVNSSTLVKKNENNMILTDQFGKVVANNTIASIVAKTEDAYPYESTAKKTCYAIIELINEYKSKTIPESENGGTTAMQLLYKMFKDSTGEEVDEVKKKLLAQNMIYMLENGGYKGNRIIYSKSGTAEGPFYLSASEAKEGKGGQLGISDLELGCCYEIRDANSAIVQTSCYFGSKSSDGTDRAFIKEMTLQQVKYLSNLISYFGPIISAAIQNGTSSTAEVVPQERTNTAQKRVAHDDYYIYQLNGQKPLSDSDSGNVTFGPDETKESITQKINSICNYANGSGASNAGLISGKNAYVAVKDKDGIEHYFIFRYQGGHFECSEIDKSKYYEGYTTSISDNSTYLTAQNTEKLQAGFRSGTYQLAMVTDTKHGIYHKNTTMNFFTHMNYVVEKTDSSKREEITAWFNSEQAEISEQETYWDTEIQNLSAELSAVNTEISSVKQLKSDNIKSVFNWGGSS